MSEKIKQFMIQSGTDISGKWMSINNAEKFAELIVQECIDMIKPTSDHEAFAQNYLGGVDGLELLDGKIKNIKEHFGVSE
jgi:hypothetical protein